MAPTQAVIIPVNNNAHSAYAKEVTDELRKYDIRCKLDNRNERLGLKIREAQTSKIPFQIVIGDAEVENKNITIREYGSDDEKKVTLQEFISIIK
jgi:threonyl-tRNA synthetase